MHDAIDRAAVALGREAQVGNGDPRTTWNDEPMTDAELAESIWSGGQGSAEFKLILVVGDTNAVQRIKLELKSHAVNSSPRSAQDRLVRSSPAASSCLLPRMGLKIGRVRPGRW